MKYKTDDIHQQFLITPIILKVITLDFEHKSLTFGIEPVITSIFRKKTDDSGVHELWRAIDLRDEYDNGVRRVNLYTPSQRASLVDYINLTYPRTDGFKTCIWHGFQGGPHHFHIQVPLYTTMIAPIEFKQHIEGG